MDLDAGLAVPLLLETFLFSVDVGVLPIVGVLRGFGPSGIISGVLVEISPVAELIR